MKTREQLIYEMSVTIHETVLSGTFDTTEKLLDLIVNACEETIKESPEWAFENLKKLKSK
jgi:hypothetical protein